MRPDARYREPRVVLLTNLDERCGAARLGHLFALKLETFDVKFDGLAHGLLRVLERCPRGYTSG